MDRAWTSMNTPARKEMNLCLWGEHAVSRFFQYTVGTTVMNTQENYQQLLEKGFSGGNRNPISRPTLADSGNTFQVDGPGKASQQLATFGGLASLIPERSAIQGKLPFCTNFSLGNGEIYFNAYRLDTDGEVTEKHLFALFPTMQRKFHVPKYYQYLKEYV